MARYSAILDDQYGRPYGALVAVSLSTATPPTLAVITADDGSVLANPLPVGADGAIIFNANDNLYDLAYFVGGRRVGRDLGVIVGDVSSLPAGSVANFLGTATNVAPSQAAVKGGLDALSADIDTVAGSITGKADRFPSNSFSLVTAGYHKALNDVLDHWSNGTNLVPTIGDGGALNGLPNPDNTAAPSTWQMATIALGLYEAWKLAVDQGDTLMQGIIAALFGTQWTYYKTKYSLTDIKAGTGGIVNTSDDGRLFGMWLCQVHEITSASDALTCAEEFHWANLTRFHDPKQTAVSYGISTPGGVACKSDPNGILYPLPTNFSQIQAFGYVSSSNEFGNGLAALYLYSKNVSTKAACLLYAQNIAALGHSRYLTPAPANSGKAAQYLIYTCLNLDPNVAAANATASAGSIAGTTYTAGGTITGTIAVGQYLRAATVTPGTKILSGSGTTWTVDTSQTVAATLITSSLAMTGLGDPLESYLGGQKSWFGAPERGTCAEYLDGTSLFASLCAELNAITPTATYLADAVNSTNAIASLQGFGRSFQGMPYLIQARDPWSDGDNLPRLARRCLSLAGADPDNHLKFALVNSAKAVMVGSPDGYLTPDWTPREKGTGTTETWLEDGAAGYGGTSGGGQAEPRQIMTHGSSLGLVIAAARVAPAVALLGTGATTIASVEAYPADAVALMAGLDARMPRTGGQFVGQVRFRIPTFFLDLNNVGIPYLNWANNAIDQFDTVNLRRQFFNGTTASPEFQIGASGAGTQTKGSIRWATTTSLNQYLDVNGQGDTTVNLANGMFVNANPATSKVYIGVGSTVVFSIDASGNVVLKGTLTQSGTPTR